MSLTPETFKKTVQIRFHHADPAGIMYFANVFNLAHETFEDFIVQAGVPWKNWFQKNEFIIPIRHAESDFFAPFLPGESYDVLVHVISLSESSFKMKYIFQKNTKVHAIVKMVHTYVDPKTKVKAKIPQNMISLFQKFLQTESL